MKERFDAHFNQRRNTIFERAKFNSRKQEAGVDDFITDLQCLARLRLPIIQLHVQSISLSTVVLIIIIIVN